MVKQENTKINLPLDLEGGLQLRWATKDDQQALADFNALIHVDPGEEQVEHIRVWTKDLLSGRHPTVKPDDFTVVVDKNAGNKIVSTCMLIPQTWTYEGIPFGVGRVELVGTDEAYRRRGLVRWQMDVLHAKSQANGDLVTAITGIPWYYRQFGYEMTVNLGGGRYFLWHDKNRQTVKQEPYQMRAATLDDIPFLANLYEQDSDSLLRCLRSPEIWQYLLTGVSHESTHILHFYIVEKIEGGEAIGYFNIRDEGKFLYIEEMAVTSGHSLRALGLFVARHYQPELGVKQPLALRLRFGREHKVYEAFGRMLNTPPAYYAWYMRVPDLPAFLQHIAPVLNKRLASSVMAGYTGTLKLGFYRDHIQLRFEQGQLREILPYKPQEFFDMDAAFPELTFLHLLFGYQDLPALRSVFADCGPSNIQTEILLNALFPKREVHLNELN